MVNYVYTFFCGRWLGGRFRFTRQLPEIFTEPGSLRTTVCESSAARSNINETSILFETSITLARRNNEMKRYIRSYLSNYVIHPRESRG